MKAISVIEKSIDEIGFFCTPCNLPLIVGKVESGHNEHLRVLTSFTLFCNSCGITAKRTITWMPDQTQTIKDNSANLNTANDQFNFVPLIEDREYPIELTSSQKLELIGLIWEYLNLTIPPEDKVYDTVGQLIDIPKNEFLEHFALDKDRVGIELPKIKWYGKQGELKATIDLLLGNLSKVANAKNYSSYKNKTIELPENFHLLQGKEMPNITICKHFCDRYGNNYFTEKHFRNPIPEGFYRFGRLKGLASEMGRMIKKFREEATMSDSAG